MPKRASANTPAWRVERTYPTPEGTRLNLAAAVKILGLNPRTFWSRQQNGWVLLGGGKLHSRRMQFTGGRGWEETYLESDVLALRDKAEKPAGGDGWYDTPAGPRLNRQAVRDYLKVHYNTVQKWERKGLLTPEKIRAPVTGYPEKTYALAEVKGLAATCAAPAPKRMEGPGGWYIPRQETLSRLEVSHTTLTDWTKQCLHLPGGRGIRVMPGGTANGGRETWYHEQDVEDIKARLRQRKEGRYLLPDGAYLTHSAARRYHHIDPATLYRLAESGEVKTAPHPGEAGDERHPRIYREADIVAYMQGQGVKFDGLYETPEGPRWNLGRAARESGYTRSFLKKQIKKSLYLPEGKLPSKPMKAPSRRRREHTVLPADLDRLRFAIAAAMGSGEPAGNWGDAEQIANRRGITDLEGRIALGARLKEWRQDGRLSTHRVWRRHGGGRRRVWLYDLDELDALLANEAGAALPEQPPPAPPAEHASGERKGRGRRRSEATEAVYKFCYEAYTERRKMTSALKEAERLFGPRAPKDKATVRLYARRFAARYELPCQRPSPA
jgi:hypothetical protein